MPLTGSVTGYVNYSFQNITLSGLFNESNDQVGNDKMTLGLEWHGQEEFNAQELAEWKFNGTAAGLTRSAGPLTFVTLYDAGHMVSVTFAFSKDDTLLWTALTCFGLRAGSV